ncbi:MAG: hypothetical protein P4L46_26015 [Fimbriimonas sp.]|nr:hypothetical protein [Fimbriimonas sp.]
MKQILWFGVAALLSACGGGGSAPAGLRTYSTAFPATENPVDQHGVWINGHREGLDWCDVATTHGLARGTESGNVQYDDSTALLAGVWKPDQGAEATVHSVNQTSTAYEEVELRLRSAISAHEATGYEINFRCLKTGDAYCQIVRWNGPLGKFTYLNAAGGASFGVSNGDVVKATVVGHVITAFINGKQVLQATDPTYATGNPGIGLYLAGPSGLNRDYGFTRFSAWEMKAGS